MERLILFAQTEISSVNRISRNFQGLSTTFTIQPVILVPGLPSKIRFSKWNEHALKGGIYLVILHSI